MTTYDALAEQYDAGRIGYSLELYNMLLGFGLSQRHHVIDVACGTGIASRPLIENGFRVTGVDSSEPMLAKAKANLPAATWVAGSAEELPFGPDEFDAAISAQAFHHVNRAKALAEIVRVLRPGGIVAIWWKLLTNDDPVKIARDKLAREMGVDPPQSGLRGGFKEFYASPLQDRMLRVVPWQVSTPLTEYMKYERSRKIVYDAFGPNAQAYFSELERRLRGDRENPTLGLGYIQFLYMARTPGS
jgi:SAM-dependent methyltransferase